MAVPAQTIKKDVSRAPQIEARTQLAIGAIHSPRIASAPCRLGGPGSDAGFRPLHSAADSVSSEKTRVALLKLAESPGDNSAIDVLWEENHVAIEREMKCHLHSSSNLALLKRILSGVVSLSKFFCTEIDDPKEWVARCANLETRRVALQLTK